VAEPGPAVHGIPVDRGGRLLPEVPVGAPGEVLVARGGLRVRVRVVHGLEGPGPGAGHDVALGWTLVGWVRAAEAASLPAFVAAGILAAIDQGPGRPHLGVGMLGPEHVVGCDRIQGRPIPGAVQCQRVIRTAEAMAFTPGDAADLVTVLAGR